MIGKFIKTMADVQII